VSKVFELGADKSLQAGASPVFELHDDSDVYIPHEVIGLCVEKGMSLLAAWRTHKGLSQSELAERMGITQPGVAQMERPGARLQKRTLEKVANALGLAVGRLEE
jgi:DNA-binding XRE family transcriptional regulator